MFGFMAKNSMPRSRPNWRRRRSVESLGSNCLRTKYDATMELVQQYLVSSSGQMSLPAGVRHRWGLDNGGPVDVLDLGYGVLTVPAGQGRALLDDLLPAKDHAAFVQSVADDPDLATT